MVWWKPWTWDDDERAPTLQEKREEQFKAGDDLTRDLLKGKPDSSRQLEAARTNRPRLGPAVFDPSTASRPTQRYLRAAGWNGPQTSVADKGYLAADLESLRSLDPHSYKLTPWQQEQAAGAYGVDVPEESPELYGESYRTGRLTPEAYASLTPQQQKTLKFNELLLAAVEADRGTVRGEDAGDYDTRLAEMFGTQGGSETYAPNTLRLLEGMDMGRLRGQDLDEYLSLDRAYDANELQALQPWEATPEPVPYESFGQARSQEFEGILDQRQVDMAGSLIEKALADTSIRGWDENARVSQYLGNRPAPDEIPFGWLVEGETRSNPLDMEKEYLFRNLYDYLSSDQAQNLDEFWAATESKKFTDEDYKEIYDYFYLQSLEDDRTGIPAGYRTGQQTRDFIGIGG